MKRLTLLIGLTLAYVRATAHKWINLRTLVLSFGSGLDQVAACQ